MTGRWRTAAALLPLWLAFPAVLPAEPTEIVVQFPNPATFQTIQEALAADFEDRRPDIRVRHAAPAADYRDMLQRTLRGSLGGRLPDIGFYDFATADLLARRSLLPPLTPEELAYVRKSAGEMWAVGPAEHCVPFALSVPVLFVNATLLAKIESPLPKPAPDWGRIANLGSAAGRLPGEPAGVWLPLDRLADWLWQTLLNGRGGEVLATDGSVTAFEGPAARAAVTDYAALADSNFYFASSNQAIQAFVGGRLLFLFGSNAVLERLRTQIAERFQLDMWPAPVSADGHWPAGGNCAAVLAGDTEVRRAAVEYIAWLVQPAQGRRLLRTTGYFPAARAVVTGARPDAHSGAYARLLRTVARRRLVHWQSYPGRGGTRVPEMIRRGLERLALDPDHDALELLRDLDGRARQLTERPQ